MPGIGKPEFTGRAPEYRHVWLLPANRSVLQIPIKVWAFKTADGLRGWLDSAKGPGNRTMPTDYPKKSWKEVTETQALKLLKSKGKASVAAEPVAKGLVKAGVAAEPEPPPEPTGTDPGTAEPDETVDAAQAESTAATLDVAIGALAQVARALRTVKPVAVAPVVASKPGLRKAGVKPVASKPAKRAARR